MSYMNISLFIKEQLEAAIQATYPDYSLNGVEIHLERPAQQQHGDFASPIALVLFKESSRTGEPIAANPRVLADAIAQSVTDQLTKSAHPQWVSAVTVAGPGFINFTLSSQYLLTVASSVISSQGSVYMPAKSAGTAIIEYVSPNTNKPLHIGHVRNAALGSAMGRLLELTGWTVKRSIINNDRGLHITKSMWAYLLLGKKIDQNKNILQDNKDATLEWQSALAEWVREPSSWLTPSDMTDERLQKPDHFVGYWYQLADAVAEDPEIQAVWSQMLIAWEGTAESEHAHVRLLWKHLNAYFYAGFAETAKVLGAQFDPSEVHYESEIYQAGKEIVLKAAERGVFTRLEDGAIKVNLDAFNLPEKILLRRDGTGIYMTFDIELTRQRASKQVDKIVWVVGNDQTLYFQQLFAVAELLGYGKQEKFLHFAYGMVRLPEGKMSSRKGRVVYADDLLTAATDTATSIMQQSGVAKDLSGDAFVAAAQAVGIGAVKWTMLAQDAQSQLVFDITESVNFAGFAAPYIQYTHARTHSIFNKAEQSAISLDYDMFGDSNEYIDVEINEDEKDLLINISKYFDVVEKASAQFEPHRLCVYLHELAQSFNTLYAHHTIVAEAGQQTQLRLALTKATQRILSEGLETLGIVAVERM